MNINKNWLKDEEGNLLAPRTLTSCIQDENGKAFQDYADNMVIMSPEETTDVPEDLTSCISNQDMYNIVSDAYDSTKTYAVGDYCIYNNVAYKCTTAIDTAEEFDSAKWTATRIGTEVSELNNKLTDVSNKIQKNNTLSASLQKEISAVWGNDGNLYFVYDYGTENIIVGRITGYTDISY